MSATTDASAPVAVRMTRLSRFDRTTRFGLLVVLAAALIYWLSAKNFDATRGDFFYLADAFLHLRTWLDVRLGYQDVIVQNGHIFVPFAPFPAIAFMPLVALIGAVTADQWETGIN